jgi:prevent-host-death family protein
MYVMITFTHMQVLPDTISARTIQREYRRVFDEVRAKKKPLIVTNHNQPEVAIVSMDLLEKIVTLDEQASHPKIKVSSLAPQVSNVAELNDNLDEIAVDFKGKAFSTEEIDRIYRKRMLEKHGRYLS